MFYQVCNKNENIISTFIFNIGESTKNRSDFRSRKGLYDNIRLSYLALKSDFLTRLELPLTAVAVNMKIVTECGDNDDLKILKSWTYFHLGEMYAAVGGFSVNALESYRNAFVTQPCNLLAFHRYFTYVNAFPSHISAIQIQASIDFIKNVMEGAQVTPDNRVVYRYYNNQSHTHECSFFSDDANIVFNGSKPLPLPRPMDAYYEAQTILSKALSGLYHATGDFAKSWQQLSSAMSYHRNISMLYFQLSNIEDIINSTYLKSMEIKSSVISTIHQQRILASNAVSSQSKLPVFIVGFHNSGAKILSSLLRECCQHVFELNDVRVRSKFSFDQRADAIIQDIVAGKPDLSASLSALSKDLLQHIKAEFSSGEESDYSYSISDDILRESSALYQDYVNLNNEVTKLSMNYSHSSHNTKRKKRRLTSSTRVVLSGDELYFYIDLIRSLYPQALIINVLRDPMDVIFECVKDGIASHPGSSRNKAVFGWGLNEVVDYKALIGEYILYLNTMHAFKSQQVEGTAAIIDIQFETMLSNPTGVLAYLGHMMNSNCHYKTARDFTEGAFTVASIGVWPKYFNYLNKTLIATARTFLSDLKKENSLPFTRDIDISPISGSDHIIECAFFRGGLEKYCTYSMNWNLDPMFNYSSMVLEISSTKEEESAESCNKQESEERILANDSTSHLIGKKPDSADSVCTRIEINRSSQEIESILIGKSVSRKIQSIIHTVDGYKDILEVEEQLANLSLTLGSSRLYYDASTCISGNGILNYQDLPLTTEVMPIDPNIETHCLNHLLLVTLFQGRLLTSLGRGNAAVRAFEIGVTLLRIFNDSILAPSASVTDNRTACTYRETNIRISCETNSSTLMTRQYTFRNCQRSLLVDADVDVWLAKLQADAYLQSDNASAAVPFLMRLIDVPNVYPTGDYTTYFHTALAIRETERNGAEKSDVVIKLNSKLSDSVHAQYGISTGNLILGSTTCDCCLSSDDSAEALAQRSNIYWSYFVLNDVSAFNRSIAWQYLHCAHTVDLHSINISYSFGSYFIEQVNFNSFITSTYTRDFWKVIERSVDFIAGPDLDRRSMELQKSLNDIRLVFIVSFFRSGSTLLETILDSHPSVWGMGEKSIFALHMEAFEKEFNQLIGDKNGHQRRLQVVEKFRVLIVEDIVRSRRRANETEAVIVIDKMLNNYRNIGCIHLLFPTAVILYILRDPMDTLVSCYTTRFKNPLLRYLAADPDTLTREYAMHLQLMSFFLSSVDQRYLHTIVYEQLVAHPAAAIQDLLTRLGLCGSGAALVNEYFLRQRVVHTASRFQVKKAVYNTSVGRWTRYASDPAVVAIKNNLLRHFKELLGNYSLPLYGKKDRDKLINWQLDNNFNYTNLLCRLSVQ